MEKNTASYRGCATYKQYKNQILKLHPTNKRERPNVNNHSDANPLPTLKQDSSKNTTRTFAEAVKTRRPVEHANTSGSLQEADNTVDLIDKMFTKFQHIMTNMMDSMMDRMIQLISNMLSK